MHDAIPQGTTNHPAKPIQGDDEDYVDYLGRCADLWSQTPPPAPPGFHLVECRATPRHWPEYTVADDDFYEGGCSRCIIDDQAEVLRAWQCKAEHRRWKSWKITAKVYGWLYLLGIAAAWGSSYGRCAECGVGVQHGHPRWRGKRSYILGKSVDDWACLRRGHRHRPHIACGLCSVCMPCPECGSTDPTHYSCEVS